MKKTILFLIFLVCNLFTVAQIRNVSISLQGNSTFMRSVSNRDPYYIYLDDSEAPIPPVYRDIIVKESYTPKVGFDFKFKADYTLTSKLFFSSGIALNYYCFNRNTQRFVNLTSKQIKLSISPFSPKKTDKSVIYVQVPVLVGSSFLGNKLILRAGASLSFILDAYGYRVKYNFSSNDLTEFKTTQTSTYNSLLFNAVAESTYKISKKLGIDLSFQKSFTTIYTEPNREVGKTRYNAISLGMSYFLK